MSKDNGGPAFPIDSGSYDGITIRDYFAAKAMQSQLVFEGMEGCETEKICGMAYEIADAMLKARNQGERV